MRNAKMDTEELRTFVEVADAGGVSQAARRLGVSKSIVSRRLLRLETELGVHLLARTTRGTVLTEAGATFRDYAARISAEIDVAKETILPEGELRGRLRISAPLTYGPTHIAPILAEMARRHPRLSIQTCYTDRFTDLAAEGYDCAIRVGYLQDSALVARRVAPSWASSSPARTTSRRTARPRRPTRSPITRRSCRARKPGNSWTAKRSSRFGPRGRFKADNGTALVAAAVAGLGLAWLPDDFTDEHVASGPGPGHDPLSAARSGRLRRAPAGPASRSQDPHPHRAVDRILQPSRSGGGAR
jgi:DNA-binding transcriptional LysR family regulator